MPAPIDRLGERFGDLIVIARGPRVVAGGAEQWSWQVKCRCGARETYPAKMLTSGRVTRCSTCARPLCQLCGAPFTRTNPNQRYCQDPCAARAEQRTQREAYYRKKERDPDAIRRANTKARAKGGEARREQQRALDAAHRERIRSDPDRLERVRAYGREWKRARYALMKLDPEAFAAWRQSDAERRRDYDRQWQKDRRAARGPAEIEADRTARAERARRAALDELLQILGRARSRADKKGR